MFTLNNQSTYNSSTILLFFILFVFSYLICHILIDAKHNNHSNHITITNYKQQFRSNTYIFNPIVNLNQQASGNIDAEELQALLQAAGKKVSAIEIRKLIEEVDAVENGGNGDGLISESEFLRMLRDNKGPNIFAEATRMRANQVNQRRLELEAAKRSKTENKLESDKQKQIRKNSQLAEEAERLRLANDDKARQVAEYNEREYENTTNEKERVRREDMERQALVKKRQDDKQAELNEAGRIKQAALEEAERLRTFKIEKCRSQCFDQPSP